MTDDTDTDEVKQIREQLREARDALPGPMYRSRNEDIPDEVAGAVDEAYAAVRQARAVAHNAVQDMQTEYVEKGLDEARCPECGNEDGITKTERANELTQPIPPEMAGNCPECDHSDHPLAFHSAWKRERMSEEELEANRKAREKYEGKAVDYETSAHAISMRREP